MILCAIGAVKPALTLVSVLAVGTPSPLPAGVVPAPAVPAVPVVPDTAHVDLSWGEDTTAPWP